MIRTGLIALIIACFTFAFAMPAANANRMNDTDVRSNSITNDMNRGYNEVKSGMNRAANKVEQGVDNALDMDDDKTSMMNRSNYNATNYKATATGNDDDFNWGWLGLLGLIGLAGMRSRDRGRT